MDMTDIRRTRLRQLIDERFGGTIARLAEAIDRQPNYVSRVLGGKKGIKEDFCRYVETTLGLSPLWLDGEKQQVPHKIEKFSVDPELLWKVAQAINAHLDADQSEMTEEWRVKLSAMVYSGFHKRPDVSVAEIQEWLDQWWPIIQAKKGG